MRESLGLVEVRGLSNAIIVADTMVKTANVKLKDVELTKGMGYVTVKVTGNVGAVKAAVNSGKMMAISVGKYISSTVIARPAEKIDEVFVKDDKEKETKSEKPQVKEEESKSEKPQAKEEEQKSEKTQEKEESKSEKSQTKEETKAENDKEKEEDKKSEKSDEKDSEDEKEEDSKEKKKNSKDEKGKKKKKTKSK